MNETPGNETPGNETPGNEKPGNEKQGTMKPGVSGTPPYDDQNVFAKILRGEIPCRTVFEDEFALAFHDINPQAPHHVLVIPKGRYVAFADFAASASDAEITGFVRAVGHVARLLGFEESGYRLLANMGPDSHQEVPHLHVHIFAGRPLGPMLVS